MAVSVAAVVIAITLVIDAGIRNVRVFRFDRLGGFIWVRHVGFRRFHCIHAMIAITVLRDNPCLFHQRAQAVVGVDALFTVV